MRIQLLTLPALAAALLAAPARADSVGLNPDKDNSMFQEGGGALSNGAGPFLFAGATLGSNERRGLLHFDVAGSIPAGSTITGVTLTLECTRESPVGASPTVGLHRALADWGEGTSDSGSPGGGGAASTAGDATWINTFFPGSLWASAGGDFAGAASATQTVSTSGSYSWTGGSLVADVQDMLDNGAGNFGWLLLGGASPGDAKRFNSRENASNAPVLDITYDPPVLPVPAFSRLGVLGMGLLLLLATAFVTSRRSAAA